MIRRALFNLKGDFIIGICKQSNGYTPLYTIVSIKRDSGRGTKNLQYHRFL